MPGSRWGPPRLSWRASDNYFTGRHYRRHTMRMSDDIQVEAVPNYYWQVVPASTFVSSDLSRYILRDEPRYEPILQETRPLGNVAINNNVVVNNVLKHQLRRAEEQQEDRGSSGRENVRRKQGGQD